MCRRLVVILLLSYGKLSALAQLDPPAGQNYMLLPSADGLLADFQVFGNADDSSQSNHASLEGGAYVSERRMWFDGTNAVARTASNGIVNATMSLTVMAWIYPTDYSAKTAAASGQAVVSKYDTVGNMRSWELAISIIAAPLSVGSITVQFGSPVGVYSGRAALRQGYTYSGYVFPGITNNFTWHHLAFTFDQGTVRIFVNGIEYEPEYYGTIPTTLYTSTLPLTVGNNHNYEHGFIGGIGQVRIYGRVAVNDIYKDFWKGPPQ